MPATLREVYLSFGEDNEAGAVSRRLIEQQHWYNSLADFDPKTGQALPLGLDEVLRRLVRPDENAEIRDRLWRIVEHGRAAVGRLLDTLSESPRREQALLPIHAVRELNATSLIALNRRPGRNIREKIAGNPYMQAVRRYQSIDLPQNQLLKEYVTRLADLLELRARHLHREDSMLAVIHRWLHTDEAQAISRWANLPPNNSLLSHKDYRRVWDAWRWLQTLDEDIQTDLAQADARAAVIGEWQSYAASYAAGTRLFGDMPVLFDHEAFTVTPWMARVAAKSVQSASRRAGLTPRTDREVCVDLIGVHPKLATESHTHHALSDAFVWQRWQREGDAVDIDLFEADVPVLHPDSTTVALPDLFFRSDLDSSLADIAAHSFARRLRSRFPVAALTWLIPDRLSEFDLGVLRRNLNARFPQAEPLPRSVAAVFDSVQHEQIKREGFAVLVVDTTGGVTTATKLVARVDSELAERLPITRGYYWERTPTISLDDDGLFDPLTGIAYIGADGQWREAHTGDRPSALTKTALRAIQQIEPFDELIQVTTSPVAGGAKVHQLQLAADDIPIWRDHIPELSIKAHVGGRYQQFYLVNKHTTIRPIRGLAVEIPVVERFTLPAGRAHYQFPLYQGSDANDLGFEARLDSPSFPLAVDTSCRLTLTYTYGADEPYRLVLTAIDNSLPPIHVKWRPKSDEPITDAPAPGYPAAMTWDELQHQYDATRGQETDYLDWAIRQSERHLVTLAALADLRQGVVKTDWKTNPKGMRFLFIEQNDDDDVYVGEFDVVRKMPAGRPALGDKVYFLLARKGSRVFARHLALAKSDMIHDIAAALRRGLYVPYIKTWGDGRCLTDASCPPEFRNRMAALIPRLEQAMRARSTPVELQRELLFLLCCMHRDMPHSVTRDLISGASAETLDERAYSFALGDLTLAWQNEVLMAIRSREDVQMLAIFAQAIWRTRDFVRAFDAASLASLGGLLLAEMQKTNEVKQPDKQDVSRMTKYCELLLGLLRSRDSEMPEVRMTFQPSQELTRLLADQVDRAASLIQRSGLLPQSRVEIADLPDKPEGDTTPDLLYALRLYLTGEVGADAIRVTGVLDGEND